MSNRLLKSCCEYYLTLGHKYFVQAVEKFTEADRLVTTELKRKIMDSKCLITERKGMNESAKELTKDAKAQFNKYEDECMCGCNGTGCTQLKCQTHLEQAYECYAEEERMLECIEDLLDEVMELINKYEQADNQGDYYLNHWLNCLHDDYVCK